MNHSHKHLQVVGYRFIMLEYMEAFV